MMIIIIILILCLLSFYILKSLLVKDTSSKKIEEIHQLINKNEKNQHSRASSIHEKMKSKEETIYTKDNKNDNPLEILISSPECFSWIKLPKLQSNNSIQLYSILYTLQNHPDEKWTKRYNNFKKNDHSAEFAITRIFCSCILPLIRNLDITPDTAVFIPALSANESYADSQRIIPLITKICAHICKTYYNDTALSKRVHKQINALSTASERSTELSKAHYTCKKISAEHIFIFDDSIDEGESLATTAQAISKANPKCKIYILTLSKVSNTQNKSSYSINEHVPPLLERIWKESIKLYKHNHHHLLWQEAINRQCNKLNHTGKYVDDTNTPSIN